MGVAYFHEAGMDVIEVEEEGQGLKRELLTFSNIGQLQVWLMVADGYKRMEEDAICPWDWDRANDVIRTGALIEFNGLP